MKKGRTQRSRGGRQSRRALFERAAAPSYRRIDEDLASAPPTIQRILELIRSDLFRPELKATEVRRRLGLRSHNVITQFRRHTGATLRRYIEDRRLDTASRLILESEESLDAIASQIGYASYRVFSDAFARRLGCRPKVYRQSGGSRRPHLPRFLAGVAALPPGSRCARCRSELEATESPRVFEDLEPLCDPCALRYAPTQISVILAPESRKSARSTGIGRVLRGIWSTDSREND